MSSVFGLGVVLVTLGLAGEAITADLSPLL